MRESKASNHEQGVIMGAKKGDLGRRLVAEFSEFRNALRNKEPVQKRYTVRTVELDLRPKEFDAEDVKVIRHKLNVSQAVFGKLCGVSVQLVSAWEQGTKRPSGPACRVLEMMDANPKPWQEMLRGKGEACGK